MICFVFFVIFKQKTAYEMRISDWSSDVCSSDLLIASSTLSCIASDCSKLTEGTRVEATARFFSSSFGMNSDPSSPNAGIAARKKTSPAKMNGHGRAIALSRKGKYRSFDFAISQTSFSATRPSIRISKIAGTSVIARLNAELGKTACGERGYKNV